MSTPGMPTPTPTPAPTPVPAPAPAPAISIIMPVYNTGRYLREAVDSVLQQQGVDGTPVPPFELVIVDDHSSDALTLSLLDALAAEPHVRVLKNARGKGAAGARNTGIVHARGEWISFLDSDDLLFPDALAIRWQAIAREPGIAWLGAKFHLLKPVTGDTPFPTRAALAAALAPRAPVAPPLRMERPVAAFGEACLIGIMTVMIRRELIEAKQLFNEQLLRAEDYHLWFQCARENDLWLLPVELAWYRIHAASLTHGDAPLLLHEDTMVKLLLADPAWSAHKALLTRRYDLILQDYCYFYRRKRRFGAALRAAASWVAHRPWHAAAWKEVAASIMLRN